MIGPGHLKEESMPPAKLRDKFLVVAVDALFGKQSLTDELPETMDTLQLARPALEKAYQAGWAIYFWTWRSRSHYAQVASLLQTLGVWCLCDPLAEDPVLIRHRRAGETRLTTKLSLLESRFGSVLDSRSATLTIIDRDPLVANAVQSYLADRGNVHLSPQVWFNIIALSSKRLDTFLSSTPHPALSLEGDDGSTDLGIVINTPSTDTVSPS